MSKLIVYVDMDGVVADFDSYILERVPNLNTLSEEERDAAVDKCCIDNPTIFRDLKPIPGAIGAVKRIITDYRYDVYFLSSPMQEVPASYTDKRLWLIEHFGKELVHKRLILSHRKDLNKGDFLIDDRLHNGAKDFKGYHYHFGQPRYANWEAILSLLSITGRYKLIKKYPGLKNIEVGDYVDNTIDSDGNITDWYSNLECGDKDYGNHFDVHIDELAQWPEYWEKEEVFS